MRDNRIGSRASLTPNQSTTIRHLTRREVFGGGAALGVLTLSGSEILDGAFSPAFAEPKRGGVLKAAFSADPAGFDPVRGPSGMSHVVIEQVYSTLMALDPDAKPYPELAESYEVSDDGLREGFGLFLRLASRDHRVRRCRGPAHCPLQLVSPDRPVPRLYGVPRQFDRAQETC